MKTLLQFYESLPQHERIMVDALRELVKGVIPDAKEKFSYGVPYFYRNKGICIIWPASVPRGGFKEGVLFGFQYGFLLKDEKQYLKNGTNKKVYYRIFQNIVDIDFDTLEELLREASRLDDTGKYYILKPKKKRAL